MSWTTPSDLQGEVQKWWDRGDLLREQLRRESSFPRKLKFKTPSSGEMTGKFEELRNWISSILSMKYYRVEMREINHRVHGKNMIPAEVWLDTADNAIAIVSKRKEAARFFELIGMTRTEEPELLSLLEKRPHQVLLLADDWRKILLVCRWVKENPRPAIYLRQVDLPSIDSKFIEKHREVLSECLDLVLPAEQIDQSATGIDRFAQRYGFKDKTQHIRFRFLDSNYFLSGTRGENEDICLDTISFANLDPKIKRVFITENEINFLSFPKVPESMVVFGAGYCMDQIAEALWLRCPPFHRQIVFYETSSRDQ